MLPSPPLLPSLKELESGAALSRLDLALSIPATAVRRCLDALTAAFNRQAITEAYLDEDVRDQLIIQFFQVEQVGRKVVRLVEWKDSHSTAGHRNIWLVNADYDPIQFPKLNFDRVLKEIEGVISHPGFS